MLSHVYNRSGVNGKAAAIVAKAQLMPTHAPSAETEVQQRQ